MNAGLASTLRRGVGTALLLALMAPPAPATAQGHEVPPPDLQIALAVQAAPESFRDGAGVLGYGPDGSLELLREGTNDLLCLAADPHAEGFSVACYHRDLEPFMARGRELRRQGVEGMARDSVRWREFEAGELDIPYGAALHVLQGSGYDSETATVHDPFLRWVIYTPGATASSTGLRTESAQGEPWLMFPGTPGAHIMFVPPRP
jgi:hypothetical protein